MPYLKLTVQVLLTILMICLLISAFGCGKNQIKFRPNWYASDYVNGQIVDRFGQGISAYDEEFNNFACLHKDDIAALLLELKKARAYYKKQ